MTRPIQILNILAGAYSLTTTLRDVPLDEAGIRHGQGENLFRQMQHLTVEEFGHQEIWKLLEVLEECNVPSFLRLLPAFLISLTFSITDEQHFQLEGLVYPRICFPGRGTTDRWEWGGRKSNYRWYYDHYNGLTPAQRAALREVAYPLARHLQDSKWLYLACEEEIHPLRKWRGISY